ncbi:MAG TPA: ectonucleotide pyrophosphatase/phosphodiesterase [Vicinamibacterales bacterium]|nr:ectonucleotide pyrophosphatase/phosphodiesterase [Vicinamibacterales bacterium]
MNRISAIAAVVFLAAVGFHAQPARQVPDPASRHAVLVTIDGLRGDYLGEADRYRLNIPNLRRLMHEGSFSGRTLSVYPTLTGTAHTALVTGVGAAKHGILGNNRFDPSTWVYKDDNPDNYDTQPAYRNYSDIKVATLWSAARARGLKTAAIGWPQTTGGPIDYRVDISMAATGPESHARIARNASPGWLDRVEQTLGPLQAVDLRMVDHVKALVAVQLLADFKPALLAVHFSITDAVQHANGPGTPAALAALEETDQNIGALVAAIERLGLAPTTTLFVTGDHGFLPMHTELAINLPLIEAGLITKGADGHPSWTAIVAPNRGLGSVYVKDTSRDAAAKARQAFERYAALYPRRFRIVERAELDAWGADRDAVFGIEPVPGYVLDGRLAPPFAQPHSRAAGHGYRPDTPGMETGLIAWGAGIRGGWTLPVTNTIDVAPTIAQILGLDLPDADGKPIVGVFKPAREAKPD